MCRLLAYLGEAVPVEKLLLQPDHSLMVQSYKPQELEGALLNADGFGVGWYGQSAAKTDEPPYRYRNILPIWNDPNLEDLSRYVQTRSLMAYIRSATPGQPVDLNNCQPFRFGNLLFVHNGLIENFRETLYRPIRDRICDTAYKSIHGTTDSEHIFALLIHQLETQPGIDLAEAVDQTLAIVNQMAQEHSTRAMVALIVGTGQRLVAALLDTANTPPSFYWLLNDSSYPNSMLLASEPLNQATWTPFPPDHLISVTSDNLAPVDYALSFS
ncbi:MAG: ergothioneine biosynthesis protein EgtC [Cyanobacteria bacterium J06626_23]